MTNAPPAERLLPSVGSRSASSHHASPARRGHCEACSPQNPFRVLLSAAEAEGSWGHRVGAERRVSCSVKTTKAVTADVRWRAGSRGSLQLVWLFLQLLCKDSELFPIFLSSCAGWEVQRKGRAGADQARPQTAARTSDPRPPLCPGLQAAGLPLRLCKDPAGVGT